MMSTAVRSKSTSTGPAGSRSGWRSAARPSTCSRSRRARTTSSRSTARCTGSPAARPAWSAPRPRPWWRLGRGRGRGRRGRRRGRGGEHEAGDLAARPGLRPGRRGVRRRQHAGGERRQAAADRARGGRGRGNGVGAGRRPRSGPTWARSTGGRGRRGSGGHGGGRAGGAAEHDARLRSTRPRPGGSCSGWPRRGPAPPDEPPAAGQRGQDARTSPTCRRCGGRRVPGESRPTTRRVDAEAARNPQEYMHAYLRSRDADAEGLPESFRLKLRRTLAHYGGGRPRAVAAWTRPDLPRPPPRGRVRAGRVRAAAVAAGPSPDRCPVTAGTTTGGGRPAGLGHPGAAPLASATWPGRSATAVERAADRRRTGPRAAAGA